VGEVVGADFGGTQFDTPNCPRCLTRCEFVEVAGVVVARCPACSHTLTDAEAFGV
jgi:hypothetical protein